MFIKHVFPLRNLIFFKDFIIFIIFKPRSYLFLGFNKDGNDRESKVRYVIFR